MVMRFSLAKYLNPIFIETGTFRGDGVQKALNAGFEKIYSIDVSPKFHQECSERFAQEIQKGQVELILGDSQYALQDLIKQIAQPATFWLDAHGGAKGKNCPLYEELETIYKHPIKTHTILIDDIRLVHKSDAWGGHTVTVEGLIERLKKINSDYNIGFDKGQIEDDVLYAQVAQVTEEKILDTEPLMPTIKYINNTSDINNLLSSSAKNVTSQHGEDGIIEKIFEVIGDASNASKWCVEFGAWDGKHLSNIYNLIMNQGWSGVLIEGNPKKYKKLKSTYANQSNVYTFNCMIGLSSNDNLESILSKTPIPKYFDLISIDIDSFDYYVWESLIQYKPTVVVIEYNPSVPNDIVFVQEKDMSVNQGASLLALIELGKLKNYELVAVTKSNGIFVVSEEYHKFGIEDNDINKMRKDLGKRIWQGYDGTIFTHNFSRLLWKRRPIDPEELQVLSKDERFFGGSVKNESEY